MKYPSGNNITIGDTIWWNEGECIGRVSLILENAEQWKQWNLDEPGIFICCDLSGKTTTQDVFYSEGFFEDEGIDRLTSAEEKEISDLHAKLCLLNPKAKDCIFNVRHHLPSKGIKWAFAIFLETSRKHYAIFENSTEFIEVSKEQVSW